jgi:methylmalonyl-CoA/ethylmalonyl-CoA epimerase
VTGDGATERTPRGWPIDHVGVAVPDLDAGAAPWLALGLPVAEDEAVPSQGVVVRLLHAGDGFVELLAPLRADTPVGRFLASRGPGLHHVAFRVGDVAAELERLRGEGARLIDETPRPGRGGSRVAFLHPRWTGGVLIELVQPG